MVAKTNSALLILATLFLTACLPTQMLKKHTSVNRQKVFSGNIARVNNALEHLSKSVGKVSTIAFYMTYSFFKQENIVPALITDSVLNVAAISKTLTNQAFSGTAWVVYSSSDIIGLITCAHVVIFPDTIYSFYPENSKSLINVAIKTKQKIYITSIANEGEATLVAYDKVSDIALLKLNVDSEKERPPVIGFEKGKSSNFGWGTPVYIMGFPQGKKLVTRAILSKPRRLNNDFFVTDALYNRGISGGPVIAQSDKIPYFKLIGMAASASVNRIMYLEPHVEKSQTFIPQGIFRGDAVINTAQVIKYGITYSVGMENIIKFIYENNEALTRNGFVVDYFFKK